MTPEFNQAYAAGWNAFNAGAHRTTNPWKDAKGKRTDRTLFLAWRQGWDEAEMRAEDFAQASK
jgi:uracil-DNA glycosylase